MTIKMIITKKDLNVLKAALKEYPRHKDITECLLCLIEVQSGRQADKE